MKIKLIGVGKCGSRLCYDFFAQIRGLPTAYEIRAELSLGGWKKVTDFLMKKTGFPYLRFQLRKQWEALTGAELLRDAAFYAIVDSDLDNNEVAKQLEVLAGNGKALAFPGRPFSLNGLTGGCQYHLISERMVHQWKSIQEELLGSEGSEIFAFAFSAAGGTGGGAGPMLAAESRDSKYVKTSTQVIHRMGIAVLPESDEPYFADEHKSSPDGIAQAPTPPMDAVEKYNVGRFFVSTLGRRTFSDRSGNNSVNGTWLVSNDLLRVMIHDTSAGRAEAGTDRAVDKQGISLINSYIGLALCTLCNASSRATNSLSDLDPRELNDHLDSFYMSAFGHAKRDSGASGESLVLQLQRLLQRALCGSRIVDGQLQGVSVPLQENEVRVLESALSAPVATLADFKKAIVELPVQSEPREFRTARKVVVILGQPQSASNNADIADAAKIAISSIFPNSQFVWYPHRHAGDLDYLLAFIVDPFVPVVVNSMFDYITQTWIRDNSKASLITSYVSGEAERKSLEQNLLSDDEIKHLPESLMGDATKNSIGTDVMVPFGQDVVMIALDRIRQVLQWKKNISPRFSG